MSTFHGRSYLLEIGIGIILLLIVIGLSGCFENVSSEETITISKIGVSQTINKPNKSIRLVVSGVDNYITVTKETNLKKVTLTGVDNIIRVSRSHSFDSTVSGLGTQILYYD